jgi:hypothetical protein
MNLSSLVAEVIVASLAADPSFHLTAIASGTTEGLPHIQPDTDVVILGVSNVHSPPDLCFHLLTHRPTLKLLLLNADTGDSAALYLVPFHQSLPATTPADLPALLQHLSEKDMFTLSSGQ